jgi:hypothetical protein
MSDIQWDIRRKGREWQEEEVWSRYQLAPEKIELIHGKIFFDDEQRLRMLGLLLEQLGADAAVRLGDPPNLARFGGRAVGQKSGHFFATDGGRSR